MIDHERGPVLDQVPSATRSAHYKSFDSLSRESPTLSHSTRPLLLPHAGDDDAGDLRAYGLVRGPLPVGHRTDH